jgi:hypothetical protein
MNQKPAASSQQPGAGRNEVQKIQRDSEALQMAYLVTSREEVWRLKDSLLAWRIAAVLGWITVFILTAVAARGEEVAPHFQPRMNTDGHGFQKTICPVPVLADPLLKCGLKTTRDACDHESGEARGSTKQPRVVTLAAGQFNLANPIRVNRCASVVDSLVTSEFLDAMECVESGMDARAVGDQGRSRGSFQFHAAGWQMVNNWRARALKPVVAYSVGAHCRSTARQFAHEYLRWLESHLAVALRRSPSRLELYAAWNLGLKGFEARGFLLGRCPAGTRDAAGRVENLVKVGRTIK